MKRAFLVATLCMFGRTTAAQQPRVVVSDAGPGPIGRYLTEVLAKSDTRVLTGDTVAITKDSVYPGSVVVIGRLVTLTGRIQGDLVVVGGDLFVKPGGQIDGEGIAIGGGAYGSLLGRARGGLTSHRDFTFDATRSNGAVELRYREQYVGATPTRVVSLPGAYGLRLPTYDRSQGVSLPVGPTVTLAGGRIIVDPRLAYRSQIGKVDPSVTALLKTGRKFWFSGYAGRETRSNEAWITGTFSNSISSILFGRDTRNWYRATAGELSANRMFESPTMTSVYHLGGQIEEATSARPDSSPTGGPWSILGRKSTKGMLRLNPQIRGGTITSVVGGADFRWTAGDVKARLDLDVEVPTSTSTGEKFVQGTIDGQIAFPTFGLQRYRLEAHGILTRGDTAPGQRMGYLGGSGTLPTEDLLVFGGDELLFLESRYEIPVPSVRLPLLGSPTVMFRHILGAAGIQTLPDLTQIVGIRLSVPFVRAQVLMDTKTRKSEFSVGLSLTR